MNKILILSLAIFLVACGRSTPTNYYMLESPQELTTTDNMPQRTLRIAQVETPAYLSRNNIVSREKDKTRLILAEFHLWSEPLGSGVRRVVEEILTPPLLAQGITVLPFGTEEKGDYVLLIDILRLDGNFNEKAVIESYWTLLGKDDRPVGRGIFAGEEMVHGANYDLLVSAESALTQEFGKYLAQKLPPLMR